MVHVPSRFSSGEQTAWCRGAVAAVQLGEERSQPSLSGGCWEQPWCVWACMWPQVHGECWPAGRGATGSLSPASPTYTLLLGGGGAVQSGLASRSFPAAPCQLGPTQQAGLSGCHSRGVQLPGTPRDGAGTRSQPVSVLASGPAVPEELWF